MNIQTSMQTSTRPTEAIAHARQLLQVDTRGGDWRAMVYATVVQLNQHIREGEERLVITTAEQPRNQIHALVNQLISARVDLERALQGPSVDDWNPAVLSGKLVRREARSAEAASSGRPLIALIVGLGTIVAVLACAILGALGLFGMISVTGLPSIIEMPAGIELPGMATAEPPTATVIVATFEPPAVLGGASITSPDPNAPPPSADASRDLLGVMPSPVPVTIVPTAEQPTAVPPTDAPATEAPATEAAATEAPTPEITATEASATAGPDTLTPQPTVDPNQPTPVATTAP